MNLSKISNLSRGALRNEISLTHCEVGDGDHRHGMRTQEMVAVRRATRLLKASLGNLPGA